MVKSSSWFDITILRPMLLRRTKNTLSVKSLVKNNSILNKQIALFCLQTTLLIIGLRRQSIFIYMHILYAMKLLSQT